MWLSYHVYWNLSLYIYYKLRNIAAIRDHLTTSATEQLIHSLGSSRLDYCNSLLYGVLKYKINYLQRVQNIAAMIVTRSSGRDRIAPYLESLHCSLVECRIVFKILFWLLNVWTIWHQTTYLNLLHHTVRIVISLKQNSNIVLKTHLSSSYNHMGNHYSYVCNFIT